MKKLLSVVAAALVALTFVGCDGLLQKDDTEGAIKGSGKKYTVEYNNESSDAYRAYKATTLKHAGALVKVTFDSEDVGTSKMGVIFDLKDAVSGVKDADGNVGRDFYCIGIGAGDKSYYVSKFTNIVDIQAKNFGATTTATGNDPKEVEIVTWTQNNFTTLPAAAEDGTVSVYVYYKALTDGSFDYKILNITDEVAKAFDLKTGTFDSSVILFEGNTLAKAGAEFDACDEGKQPQNKVAFYAQIAAGKELKGSWNVIGTYLEAEDAE